VRSTALALAVLATTASPALAAPGDLDPSFSGDGFDTQNVLGDDCARDVAVQPDGKIIVVGGCDGMASPRFSVLRYLPDGNPDQDFGTDGTMNVSFDGTTTASYAWATAVAVQPDGKIVVATGDAVSARIARLNPDGTHDTSFRSPDEAGRPPGEVSVLLGGVTTVTDLAIQAGGEIVLAGSSRFESGPVFFVSRLTVDGGHDAGFGVRGTRFESFKPGGLPGDLALRGGSILVGGDACCAPSASSMAVAEFNAGGSLTRTIRVKLPKRLQAGRPRGIAGVLPGPKRSTFVVGSAVKGAFVAKYSRDGRLDRAYRDGGYAVLRGLTAETPSSALIDSKGRVVVLGWRLDVPDSLGFRARFASTLRLLPNGRVDPTYGGARPLLVVEEDGRRVGLDLNRSYGLAQRSDRLLVMLGEAAADRYARVPSGPSFGLVRFLAGGRLR